MNVWDIVKTVGADIISDVIPGGSVIIKGINELLPNDKKLPENATGSDITNAVESLPPQDRAAIMSKQFDVQMTNIKESNETLRTMLAADATQPHTTRPRIAMRAFNVTAFISIIVVLMWAYAVVRDRPDMVTAITGGWPFIAAIVGPFVTLLLGYFGILKGEHKAKLDAAGGLNVPSKLDRLIGVVSMLRK